MYPANVNVALRLGAGDAQLLIDYGASPPYDVSLRTLIHLVRCIIPAPSGGEQDGYCNEHGTSHCFAVPPRPLAARSVPPAAAWRLSRSGALWGRLELAIAGGERCALLRALRASERDVHRWHITYQLLLCSFTVLNAPVKGGL
jgi:hypothetical protein